jgi:hypothetical protein
MIIFQHLSSDTIEYSYALECFSKFILPFRDLLSASRVLDELFHLLEYPHRETLKRDRKGVYRKCRLINGT